MRGIRLQCSCGIHVSTISCSYSIHIEFLFLKFKHLLQTHSPFIIVVDALSNQYLLLVLYSVQA